MPLVDWEPSPEDVKALLPQRLEGRDFSADTVPTREQVAATIEDVVSEVHAYLEGVDVPEADQHLARYTVKVGTAAEIERGFWPEQHDLADTATYARLIRRYRELLDQLRDGVLGGVGSGKTLESTRVRSGFLAGVDDCGAELA